MRSRFWRWLLNEPTPEQAYAAQMWAEAIREVRRSFVADLPTPPSVAPGPATDPWAPYPPLHPGDWNL